MPEQSALTPSFQAKSWAKVMLLRESTSLQELPGWTKSNLLQLETIEGGCVGEGVTMPLAPVLVGFAVVVALVVVGDATAGPATQT
jgi:hypothetical protein